MTNTKQPTEAQIRNSFHALKTDTKVFQAMKAGIKTFELRKNDRDFQVGDHVLLQEIFPDKNYTGDEIDFKIIYVLYGGEYGLPEDYCILQLERLRGMYYG